MILSYWVKESKRASLRFISAYERKILDGINFFSSNSISKQFIADYLISDGLKKDSIILELYIILFRQMLQLDSTFLTIYQTSQIAVWVWRKIETVNIASIQVIAAPTQLKFRED